MSFQILYHFVGLVRDRATKEQKMPEARKYFQTVVSFVSAQLSWLFSKNIVYTIYQEV